MAFICKDPLHRDNFQQRLSDIKAMPRNDAAEQQAYVEAMNKLRRDIGHHFTVTLLAVNVFMAPNDIRRTARA